MLTNKSGPLSFSPPKVNVLFPLQHHMVTWRWIRLMIVFESSRKQYNHLGASCSNMGRIRTKENIAVGTLLIGIATPTGGYMIVSES